MKNVLEVRLLSPNYTFKVVLFLRSAVVFEDMLWK